MAGSAGLNNSGPRILSSRGPVTLPKKPREFPVSPPQDRKGEPKRTDPEDRDLLVGEGGAIETPPPPGYLSRDDSIGDVRRRRDSRMDAVLGKAPSILASLSREHSLSGFSWLRSMTGLTWAVLAKRAAPVGQQSERILHRGLRSLLHLPWV